MMFGKLDKIFSTNIENISHSWYNNTNILKTC